MITLATLPQATAQEVFNQVASHLLKQNKKSESPNHEGCAYKSLSGLKCAAGCLISDNEYNVAMEGNYWPDLVSCSGISNNHASLISDLQKIHDDIPHIIWNKAFRDCAIKYELKTDVL